MTRLHISFVVFFACVLSAVYRPVMQDYSQGGLNAVLCGGIGANYIVWFSIVIGSLACPPIKREMPLYLLFLVMSLMLLPSATLSWIAAAFVALWLYMSNRKSLAPFLMLAACLREPLTAICLKLFAGNILSFDAIFTNIALILMGYSPAIQSNIIVSETGQPLLILTGCSVFANLSYITLLWLALHVFYGRNITPLSWLILAITMVLTLASNAYRLALMTRSEQSYYYFHDGAGSQFFEWGLMILVLIIVSGGCRYARKI